MGNIVSPWRYDAAAGLLKDYPDLAGPVPQALRLRSLSKSKEAAEIGRKLPLESWWPEGV